MFVITNYLFDLTTSLIEEHVNLFKIQTHQIVDWILLLNYLQAFLRIVHKAGFVLNSICSC